MFYLSKGFLEPWMVDFISLVNCFSAAFLALLYFLGMGGWATKVLTFFCFFFLGF